MQRSVKYQGVKVWNYIPQIIQKFLKISLENKTLRQEAPDSSFALNTARQKGRRKRGGRRGQLPP